MSSSRSFSPGGPCGSGESLQLKLDASTSTEPTALLIFTGRTVITLDADAAAFTEADLLSDGPCGMNLPLLVMPDLAVAVRVVDAAGNVSDLSSAKQVKTAGCSSAPELLGVFGVLALLHRRLQSSPCAGSRQG